VDEFKIKMPSYDFILKPKRVNDMFLMEKFQEMGFSKRQLQKLNRCRLYIQVETLSDITDGTGDQISTLCYNGQKNSFKSSDHDWPTQTNPNSDHWRLWRKALRESFPRRSEERLGRLEEPLGPWIDGNQDKWRWFYHERTSKLYCRTFSNPAWKMYKRVKHNLTISKNAQFSFQGYSHILPPVVFRATVSKDRTNRNRYRLTGWAYDRHTSEATPAQIDIFHRSWMKNTTYHNTYEGWIAEQLQTEEGIIIVSDGSYHPNYEIGTSAWVITSLQNTTKRLCGDNAVPGDTYVQCSHRSELCGLIGAVNHINDICKKYNIQHGKAELACDGMEAYKIACRYKWTHTTNIGHFDMASCLHQLLLRAPIQWNFRHVKGHQDDIKNKVDIDVWGELNILADAYAKMALWKLINNYDGHVLNIDQIKNAIPAIRVDYSGKETYIVSNLRKRLKNHIAQERILNYWKTHGKAFLDQEGFDKELFLHAGRNAPIHQQIWLPKWSCGICGVGKWLERWKDQNHSKCPRCFTDNETVNHVIQCRHPDATLVWTQGIEEIKEWMMINNAIPGLAEIFGLRLLQWRDGLPLSSIDFLDDSIQSIIKDQDMMGWDAFMFGAAHITWAREQGDYLLSLQKKVTGQTWMSQLIRKIWTLQHAMWTHRNSFMHKQGKSMHAFEEEAVDKTIREEFIIGRNGLEQEYDGLFRGNVHRLLKSNPTLKAQWIYRVWSGRDRLRKEQSLEPWFKDHLASSFLRRNQIRRKRKRRRDVLDTG